MSKTFRVTLTMTHTNTVNHIDNTVDDSMSFKTFAMELAQTIKTKEWIEVIEDSQVVAFRCSEIAFYQIKILP